MSIKQGSEMSKCLRSCVHQLFLHKKIVLYIFIVFLLLLILVLNWAFYYHNMGSNEKLVAVDFEIFGKVQGVFFRKYTEQQAKRLGLKGWCMNTLQDTVKGVMEGNPNKVTEMKKWLEKTGSPQSRIDKAVFSDERDIGKFSYDNFKIKR